MDLGLAVPLAILALPLGVVVALAIVLDSPGPVFFRQWRIGQGGRPFRMWKFRTMRVGAEREWVPPADTAALATYRFQSEDDPRITRVGRLLRRTSLDELPQLGHVICGTMSLVGPRPEVPEVVALYPPEAHRRHAVKPGITGWAQVAGRGELTTAESLRWDLAYCDARSLGLDLWILWQTVKAVLGGRGAR
ncbi:MAG: sugar transferase [Firmicutes bacterium]|nr:sugar transferase [Alicyclobacillaceae bacterium]MCL6496270.1 sugar transferase [Bacillota bacterium]